MVTQKVIKKLEKLVKELESIINLQIDPLQKCPSCGFRHTLIEFASYSRCIVTFNYYLQKVVEMDVEIPRFQCSHCKKTHAVLPLVMLENSPYTILFVIRLLREFYDDKFTEKYGSIDKLCEKYEISHSTFYRLRKRFQLQFEQGLLRPIISKLVKKPNKVSNVVQSYVKTLGTMISHYGEVIIDMMKTYEAIALFKVFSRIRLKT
jgi:transposase-like protein